MKRSEFLRFAAALPLLGALGKANAQTPSTIRILVGFPAGGAPDAVARAFAEHLRTDAGVTVVVENRPGAAGKLAIDTLLQSPTDGSTVAVMPASAVVLVPMVVKSAQYDVTRDFVPLGALARYGFGIAAGPLSQAKDLSQFKTWAARNAAQASYATPGVGTPQHFLGAQLAHHAGVALNHIPYRGGANALADVIGGQVPLLITTEQLLVPHHSQGRLHTLLVTSPERNSKMPDVPTARELGLQPLEAHDWFGLFARAGTSPALVEQWREWISKVLPVAGYKESMDRMGFGLPDRAGPPLAQQLVQQRSDWSERVRVSGFTATD